MTSFEMIGRWLVIAGVTLAVIGGIVWLLSRLPGTLNIQLGGLTCIVPILGSIVLSLLLTLVFNLVVRLLNR